jgi:hypothetical protein
MSARGNPVANASYYVWEMSMRDRKDPLRQVNKSALSLEKAKQLARIGAQKGKHDRSVTTSPTSPRGFRIVAQYAAGTGKDVAIMYRRGAGGGGPRRKKVARKNASLGDSAPDPVRGVTLTEEEFVVQESVPSASEEPEPELHPHVSADEI